MRTFTSMVMRGLRFGLTSQANFPYHSGFLPSQSQSIISLADDYPNIESWILNLVGSNRPNRPAVGN